MNDLDIIVMALRQIARSADDSDRITAEVAYRFSELADRIAELQKRRGDETALCLQTEWCSEHAVFGVHDLEGAR